MPRLKWFLAILAPLSVLSILLATAVAVPAPPSEATDLPSTPAGKRLAEWLAAFNAADRDGMARFHRESVSQARLPAEQRTDMHLQMAEFSGGLTIRSAKSLSETEVEVEATTKLSGDRVTVQLAVAPKAPHGVTGFTIRITPPAQESPGAGRMSDADIAAKLKSHLDRLAADDAFSGVVLIARDGKPFFVEAYGLANREAGTPVRLETKFSLASMSKMFTAVAVLRLADAGQLALSDTVGRHLPAYPNKAVAEKVTIEHLLTHTSGMGDFFGEKWNSRREEIRNVEDHIEIFASDPLAFEPGAKWSYSNAGYVVLGAILEEVTGKSFAEVIAEQVFEPAGMQHSGYSAAESESGGRATGYSRMGIDGKPNADGGIAPVPLAGGGPAGGGWSTAGDLLRFSEALRKHELLDAETTARATGPRVATGQGPGGAYGYGFEVHTVGGTHVFGHYGGFPGVSTGFEVYPERGYTVVILSNSDMGGQRVIGPLHGWLTRE